MKDFIDKAVPESEEERDYVSKVQNMCLMDDLLFRNVMDEPKLISKLISAVLGRYVEITEVTVEKTITNGAGRETRCDAEAKDTERNGYVAEVQNDPRGMKPKRMRFNVGLIDHHAMLRGETNWENMTDSTVIMFCAADCFGEGKVIYELPRCLNGGRRIDDGTRMIFVNCTYEGDDELGRIIHDLMCRNADDIYDDEIREKVKRIKEDRVEVEKMCETLQREYEEGMEAGAVRERRKIQAELDEKTRSISEKDRTIEEKDQRIKELEKMLLKQNGNHRKRRIKFNIF